jgi:hypothetical protein
MTATLPAISEAAFQRQVMDLVRIFRWQAYHPQLSKWSERGWPDLALVRPPRFILAELKAENGKTTPHQEAWLGWLRDCPHLEVYLWRPSDLDRIAEVLR